MLPLLAAIIITHTSSDASTGGNVVGSGGSVSNGNSDSSSYVETSINGSNNSYQSADNDVLITTNNNSGDGSATVHIKTNANGKIHEETITKTIPKDGMVEIHRAIIATSTVPHATTTVHVIGRVGFGLQLRSFFKHLFSLFGF